jgi:hypothetical protein
VRASSCARASSMDARIAIASSGSISGSIPPNSSCAPPPPPPEPPMPSAPMPPPRCMMGELTMALAGLTPAGTVIRWLGNATI